MYTAVYTCSSRDDVTTTRKSSFIIRSAALMHSNMCTHVCTYARMYESTHPHMCFCSSWYGVARVHVG